VDGGVVDCVDIGADGGQSMTTKLQITVSVRIRPTSDWRTEGEAGLNMDLVDKQPTIDMWSVVNNLVELAYLDYKEKAKELGNDSAVD